MDKKNIIGLVLIFGLFLVWMRLNAPSEEQKVDVAKTTDSKVTTPLDSVAINSNSAVDTSKNKEIFGIFGSIYRTN